MWALLYVMCVRVDLETTRSKLQDNEREKTELASLAQQRLEEIGRLNRCVCACVQLVMTY